ncbi:hypothetical protein H5T51_06475, partial [Candidatus Bathyarchaeota archaeon]|nr:hypothetical protein [Candidatus Bathyarchaeota archaeon]
MKKLAITSILILIALQTLGTMPQTCYGNPALSLKVIDAYFSPLAYPGSSNTDLYLVLNNTSGGAILYAIFNVTLPEGFVIKEPVVRLSGRINRGETFTVRFTGVFIPSNAQVGAYTVEVSVNAITTAYAFPETKTFDVQVQVEEAPPETPIMLAAVNTFYGGSPAPLLQSAKNVEVSVNLVNTLSETISSMIVNVTKTPPGVHVQAIRGTYINGMAPGGSCNVELTVDVDAEAPVGEDYFILNITYVKIVEEASITLNQEISVPVTVESFHSCMSDALEVVDSRWYEGTVGPNTYGAHLVVLVRNIYVDGLRGAVLELELPEGMRNALDNSSVVKAVPVSVQLPQPLQGQNLPEALSAILSAQQVSPTQTYSRGDILTFTATINLF